jgi:hypothetical protein
MGNVQLNLLSPQIDHNALCQEWSMLVPHAGNQAFHVSDGQSFYFNRLWHWLASKFDLEARPPPADDDPNVKWKTVEMPHDSALEYKFRAKTSYQFLLAEWAERDETQAAWNEVRCARTARTPTHCLIIDG